MYSYSQSSQIEGQAGCIGHLRGDLDGDGEAFLSSWTGHRDDLKTQDFKDEFDDVINALRFDDQYGGILKSRRDSGRIHLPTPLCSGSIQTRANTTCTATASREIGWIDT